MILDSVCNWIINDLRLELTWNDSEENKSLMLITLSVGALEKIHIIYDYLQI